MFDGVSDQFHQFIASRNSLPLPLPLSFPLHASSSPSNTFPPFDPYSLHHSNLLHPPPLHHHKDEEKEENNNLQVSSSLNLDQIQRDRSISDHHPIDPSWTNDEVLALLRIRSSMENNWFPDFTWEHVSRKLAELGFKKSAEKCKEKFEDESRYFNSNINCSKNYRFLSELEELYHGDQNQNPHHQVGAEKNQHQQKMEKPSTEREDNNLGQSLEVDDETAVGKQFEDSDQNVVMMKTKSKKRKRHNKKFEMLKGLCERIVNKMMAEQEEIHRKLLEEMVKRDEEKVAKEEAWKKQEMDRMNKELEIMAHEQAIAGDRQATIIEFLKNFTSTSFDSLKVIPKNSNSYPTTSSSLIHLNKQNKVSEPPTSSSMNQSSSSLTETLAPQNPSSTPTSSALALASQNPNSLNKASQNPISNDKDDLGKRWPRDEVMALINLRCSLYSSNNEDSKEGTKLPLWERISQGMLELGYKRSAKRCKEKWENINKYFRKTKDVNKKRSTDSRTCPYFHQLSTLYNQGTLVATHDGPENHSTTLENHSPLPETIAAADSSQGVSSNISIMHVAEGEKNMVQAPSFDFEF